MPYARGLKTTKGGASVPRTNFNRLSKDDEQSKNLCDIQSRNRAHSSLCAKIIGLFIYFAVSLTTSVTSYTTKSIDVVSSVTYLRLKCTLVGTLINVINISIYLKFSGV